jgi:hypothetical protein
MGQVVELSNNSYKPNTNAAWVRAWFCKLQKGCTRLTPASDKVGRWFSPGTPTSSTTKTGRSDIAEILLKVALNPINNQSIYGFFLPLWYLQAFLMTSLIPSTTYMKINLKTRHFLFQRDGIMYGYLD